MNLDLQIQDDSEEDYSGKPPTLAEVRTAIWIKAHLDGGWFLTGPPPMSDDPVYMVRCYNIFVIEM